MDTTPETPIDGARWHWASAPAMGCPPCSSHASVAHTATRPRHKAPPPPCALTTTTGTSNRRWACETRRKYEILIFLSFVLYFPTRASAGSPIRDLQFGREVAFPHSRPSCLAAAHQIWHFATTGSTRAASGAHRPGGTSGNRLPPSRSLRSLMIIKSADALPPRCNDATGLNGALFASLL